VYIHRSPISDVSKDALLYSCSLNLAEIYLQDVIIFIMIAVVTVTLTINIIIIIIIVMHWPCGCCPSAFTSLQCAVSSAGGGRNFHFPMSRSALGSIQPPIQWIAAGA
jgi:hypothetical protein